MTSEILFSRRTFAGARFAERNTEMTFKIKLQLTLRVLGGEVADLEGAT